MITLEVNNRFIGIKSRFGITIKRIDVSDISTRYISHTSAIDLQDFDFLSSGHNTSPVNPIAAKLRVDGTEIINGSIIPISSDKKKIRVAIYDSFLDLSTKIKDKLLRECEPIPPSAWTTSAIDTARLSTSGIVSIIIDFGRNLLYHSDYFTPCFYYKTIVEKIFEWAGYEVSGDIFTDPAYTGLIIPFFDKFEYREADIAHFNGGMRLSSSQVVSGLTNAADYKIPFDVHDFGDYINISSSQYEFPAVDYNIRCRAELTFQIGGITWNDGTYLRIKIFRNGVEIVGQNIISPAGGSGILINTTDVNFTPSDVIECFIESDAPTTGVDFTLSLAIFSNTALKTPDRNLVKWQFLMNDVTMQSIISDFFTRFGLIPYQTFNKIEFKTLNSIIADKHLAKELRGEEVEINYKTVYGKINYFKYSDSDLGAGSFEAVSNEDEKTIFTSDFIATETVNKGSVFVARIPVYDDDSTGIEDTVESPGLRVIYARDKYVSDPNVVFHILPRSDYLIGYFTDGLQEYQCGFDFFLNRYYSLLIEGIRNFRLIKRAYMLSVKDIIEITPHRIIFDNGYYLVNEVKDWIPGKKTIIELLKIF